MSTDTKISQLVINRLTKTQFNNTTPSSSELWAVDPEFSGGKLLASDASGDIVESTINPSNVVQTSALSDYVTTNTAQTISQSKAFSSPLVVADSVGLATGTILSNKKILQKTSSGIEVGNSTEDVLLVGKSTTTRPKYNGNDLALLSDAGGGGLPSQTGHSGEFLTTDGTDASWASIGLSSKMDTDMSNIDNTNNAASTALNTAGIRTVVETYTNGTDWYRIWSDGWVEQGGKITTAGVDTTVQLLKEMDNTTYHCLVSMDAPARPNPTYSIWFTYDQHSTYFKYYMSGGSSSYPMFWEVKGKMLQS